jgi:phage virion morphogenesis protein
MAGASITIDLSELVALDGRLDGLVARAADLTPLMENIGEAAVTSTVERFETESAPDGTKWAKSQRVVDFGGKTLTLGGFLGGSITHRAGSSEVEIGSGLIYARVHQLGYDDNNIVARPYLGIGGDDEQTFADLTGEYILEDLAA